MRFLELGIYYNKRADKAIHSPKIMSIIIPKNVTSNFEESTNSPIGSRFVWMGWESVLWGGHSFDVSLKDIWSVLPNFDFMLFDQYWTHSNDQTFIIFRCPSIPILTNVGIFRILRFAKKCSTDFPWFALCVLVSPKININGLEGSGHVPKSRIHRNEEFGFLT